MMRGRSTSTHSPVAPTHAAHRPAAYRANRQQRGATLLVGLIMLLLLTLQAIAAFHTSTAQLRIAGNTQDRHAAETAANHAIAETLGTGEFAIDPARVAAVPLNVDINGDGAADFTVAVVPFCRAVKPLAPSAIDADSGIDFSCVSGTAFGPASLCAVTQWDVRASAVVTDGTAQTGASAEIHQGAAVRITAAEASASC
jgi:Tfp pilus assembly protein PilX